jgi:hypothetical protein
LSFALQPHSPGFSKVHPAKQVRRFSLGQVQHSFGKRKEFLAFLCLAPKNLEPLGVLVVFFASFASSWFGFWLGPLRLKDARIGFDFHQHRWINEAAYFYHAGGGSNLVKELAVSLSHSFPISNIGDIHPCANHVLQAGTD